MDINYDRYQAMSLDDVEKIHEYTVDILTDTGIWVEDDEARDIFKKNGCRIENEKVFLNEKVIQTALENAPSEFRICAIEPRNSKTFGVEASIFAPAGGAVTICESDNIRRAPTMEDVNDFSKLVQCLDVIGLNRPAVHPSDVDPMKKFLYITLADFKYNNKIYQLRRETLEMICIIYGITPEKMKKDAENGIHYGYSTSNPVSPLELSSAATDTIRFQAEYGVPNIIAPMPIGGISAPATVEGTILIQNCENVAAIVFSSLINPKAPVFYGCIGSVGDMKKGSATAAAPEMRIIEAAGAQMARYYNIPSRGAPGSPDAVAMDFQAGAESATGFYSSVRSGVHLITNMGFMGNWMQASKAKLVLDAEIIESVLRIMQPLEITEEKTALDLIKKLGARSTYLTEKHTLKNYKKNFYNPKVFRRTTFEKWEKEGKLEAVQSAENRAKALLDQYEAPDRDPSVVKELEAYIAKHDGR